MVLKCPMISNLVLKREEFKRVLFSSYCYIFALHSIRISSPKLPLVECGDVFSLYLQEYEHEINIILLV